MIDKSLAKEALQYGVRTTYLVSHKLDNYDSARDWIGELEEFLKKNNLSDAAINVEVIEKYGDTYAEIKVEQAKDRPEADIRADIEKAKVLETTREKREFLRLQAKYGASI
jgi:hypothetical protein